MLAQGTALHDRCMGYELPTRKGQGCLDSVFLIVWVKEPAHFGRLERDQVTRYHRRATSRGSQFYPVVALVRRNVALGPARRMQWRALKRGCRGVTAAGGIEIWSES